MGRYEVTQRADAIAGTVFTLWDRARGLRASAAPGYGFMWCGLAMEHPKYGTVELLHCGEDFARVARYGHGMSPVLFPIVGRLRCGEEMGCYRHKGRKYTMDIHGFAKDRAWENVEARATDEGATVRAELRATSETREQYPFGFCFRLTYRLAEGHFYIDVDIESEGLFSVGFHPYFSTPFVPDAGTEGDCTMVIPARRFWELRDLVPTGKVLDLKEPFRKGVSCGGRDLDVVLTDLITDDRGRHRSVLRDAGSGIQVAMEAEGQAFPEIVVYAPEDQAFVCIEPWMHPPNVLNREEAWASKRSALYASIQITPLGFQGPSAS